MELRLCERVDNPDYSDDPAEEIEQAPIDFAGTFLGLLGFVGIVFSLFDSTPPATLAWLVF